MTLRTRFFQQRGRARAEWEIEGEWEGDGPGKVSEGYSRDEGDA